jgi:hypothetical protein
MQREGVMRKLAMVLGIFAIFSAGFLAGSTYTRNSLALELGGLGQTVDSLKSLGKTIVEMEKNVEELQQNINDVKKVRDDIATYQGVYNRVMGIKGEEPSQTSPTLQKGVLDLLAPKEEQKK